MGIGIHQWEWDEMEILTVFPHTSSSPAVDMTRHTREHGPCGLPVFTGNADRAPVPMGRY